LRCRFIACAVVRHGRGIARKEAMAAAHFVRERQLLRSRQLPGRNDSRRWRV
jgi:hypothetical protein